MGCSFTKTAELGRARAGKVSTEHGEFSTPAFMPVGTRASVKGITSKQLSTLGAEIVLSNTYHLHLRPGESLIKEQGGLHKFMGWSGPILTDSGGYQAFSLSKLTKSDDAGVSFNSHIDGERIELTPEKVIQIQRDLGVDIAMVLDVCSPYPGSESQLEADLTRTTLWAKRSLQAKRDEDTMSVFAIQQGGTLEHLRKRSTEAILECGEFDGYAVGGVSVGEPSELLLEVTEFSASMLPEDKPRYLMGVGYPKDIVWAVKCGIDMFDCVMPTRSARFGRVFVGNSFINIKNSQFKNDERPLEPGCPCEVCQLYSRAYVTHLVKSEEMLGPILCSIHNLTYYQRLVAKLRSLETIDSLLSQFSDVECTDSAIF